MARYFPLFSIVIDHDYFAGSNAAIWKFVPTAECKKLEMQYRTVLRTIDGGVEVWCEADDVPTPFADNETGDSRDTVLKNEASNDMLNFMYEVFCDDPQFTFYTDLPSTTPPCFQNTNSQSSEKIEILSPISDSPILRPETVSRIGKLQLGQSRFFVDIRFSEVAFWNAASEKNQISKQYRVHLKSKKIHWKYFFTGTLASKNIQIVDLDANENDTGVVFETSTHPATDSGTALVSQTAITMQYRPVQHFQLREVDMAGKILIKRLPNASVNKIGKEWGPDGQSLLVAEIYIHQ
ncbi:hypothetical protein [Undibacterium sp. TJN19]|uniref:hypothetical protein n=1 Tax=Undibacterium sp. TJN19 TaxID=3413055 RepID=UPI003BF3AE63